MLQGTELPAARVNRNMINPSTFRGALPKWAKGRNGRIIAIAFLATILLTALFAYLPHFAGGELFWGAFYPSWTANLVFFLVVGLTVTVVTTRRPEDETFEIRARILLRGRRGPPVDYIIKRLGEIEQYAERVDSQIHILRYDPDLNAYKIRVETITTVRGFYDDIVSRHQASFRYVPDRFAKPPDEIGRVLALGENGQEPVFANEVIGAEGYFRTWPIEIPAGEVRHVLARYTVYVAVGEPFSSSPMRFSERITATLSNSIDEGGLKPLVEIVQGQQPRKAQLDVEGKILICDEKNADPGVDVYCFKIHAPT